MIEVVEAYVENGKVYVATKFLENYFKTSTRNIGNWIKKGLPKYKLKGINSNVFILEEVLIWHANNINKTKSRAGKKRKDEEGMNYEETIDLNLISYEEADRRKKILDVQLASVKLKEAEGELINADELDKALYEQAIMHITKLDNDEKILPILLEMKNQDEIKKILNEHNEDHLDTLSKQIEKKFKDDPTNYDVFNEILEKRKNGIKPQELIEKLKEM
ncbi:hypothetical protein [Brevundimonas sp. FT23028]|jgi:phage terminase Nu1 subunit (DNA packaging protein)|uniref:hypothetical protein n=1 Tax=Brevundimonas sp. FT23028 TaxID=3393748 RepID=UPI003B587C8F